MNSFSVVALSVLLLALDSWVVSALASLRYSTLPRLAGTEDISTSSGRSTLNLLVRAVQALTALHLAHLVVLVALSAIAWQVLSAVLLPWAAVLCLLVGAWILALLEWILEIRVSARATHYLMRLEPSIRLVMMLFAPFYVLPLRWWGPKNPRSEAGALVTEDELKNLLDASQQEGVLELGERRMISSIFDFGDTLAREVMVPRIDVLALDVHTSLLEAVDALLQSGYSRVPVYEESIDNILGLLYAKDLLSAWRSGAVETPLRALLRPAYFVPEAKTVDTLLAEMQAQRIHMAIVVDEYGGMAGLVTLEDIVEEIVGEIRDEYDQQEEALYQQVSPGEYLVAGRMDLDDFNDLMHTDLPSEEADTLGGFLYGRIGSVPEGGERLVVGTLELTVEEVLDRRIQKVRARKVPAEHIQPEDAAS